MSKSVLIVETPGSCEECSLSAPIGCYGIVCDFSRSFIDKHGKPKICPLKGFPEEDNEDYFPDEYESGYATGWNACLRKIIG